MDLWSVSLNKRWLFVMKTVNCQFTSVLLRGKKQRPLELVLRGLLQKIGRFETSPRIGRIWRIGCLKEHQTSYSPNSSYSWRRPIFCNRALYPPVRTAAIRLPLHAIHLIMIVIYKHWRCFLTNCASLINLASLHFAPERETSCRKYESLCFLQLVIEYMRTYCDRPIITPIFPSVPEPKRVIQVLCQLPTDFQMCHNFNYFLSNVKKFLPVWFLEAAIHAPLESIRAPRN